MKFEQPVGATPLDQQRVVGTPQPRIEGPLKVSGQATYAYEYRPQAQQAALSGTDLPGTDLPGADLLGTHLTGTVYGVMVGAGVAKGSIKSIDTTQAEAAPGVLLVLTHENAAAQGDSDTPIPKMQDATPQLYSPDVLHYDQAVALVVAETFEQAQAAARLVQVQYRKRKGKFVLEGELERAKPDPGFRDQEVGDFAAAFEAAPHKVDQTYTTPDQSQAPMEPHASIAVWEGEHLTLYTSHQILHWLARGLAKTLKIPEKNIRVISRYIGGGFGSKLMFHGDAVLSALAARELGRPVKVALARPQLFNHTSHRPATIQRVRIAADKQGHFVAMGHDSWSGNLPGGDGELAADQTKLLYAGENRLVRHRTAALDLPPGGSMRAPGEAVGLLALECAVDELAEALNLDPIELRIRNDIQHDPARGPERPYSSRRLVEALQTGAKAFGWQKRQPKPGSVQEGEWLLGLGVASAFRKNLVQPSGAKVTLNPGGTLTVETQMTDIGTGSYTILAQVAAEMLGLELGQVEVKLGDSRYPEAAGSGGSFGANSATSGLYYACNDLRRAIAKAADLDPETAIFEEGYVRGSARGSKKRVALKQLAGKDGLSASGRVTWGDLTKKYVQASFGAHFAEVAVSSITGEIRVRRLLSVVSAGRILNPTTARSQCLGGMTMGVGAALMEDLKVDPTLGLFVNHDLAGYHVPSNLDIPDLDVIFLDDLDDKSSPVKAKGVGELGICGVGAAVANAVYNASGVRIREYPLTLDKVLAGWGAGMGPRS